ncbi:hypothetical protein [Bradyrhizobium paxllaeri]|uniref:hypothetical protein n=1 Tax=Bradyrhizobium paxllaeri TaxID=190148 RepID=UPI003D31897E
MTGAEAAFWTGLFVPKSTPTEAVSRLEARCELRCRMQTSGKSCGRWQRMR